MLPKKRFAILAIFLWHSTDGQDFTGGSFVLLFDATPQNTKCVVIATLPDQSIEVPETFVVNLLPGSDYSVGNPSTSSVTINEGKPLLAFNLH